MVLSAYRRHKCLLHPGDRCVVERRRSIDTCYPGDRGGMEERRAGTDRSVCATQVWRGSARSVVDDREDSQPEARRQTMSNRLMQRSWRHKCLLHHGERGGMEERSPGTDRSVCATQAWRDQGFCRSGRGAGSLQSLIFGA
jgi:hypothetical protein